ncbi:Uncharacterized protein FWK35_00033355 [Aphis craccivora]|uniref:Transposable element P transposase-like RNase H C-terminal domain-containing protein n=1 Tax=Aphis craccivora TaxID=307492 RepID=A0A6G0WP59_APHCR|nr:Uncharacterized protein FWK35_00033355 [Aphis craccivora]
MCSSTCSDLTDHPISEETAEPSECSSPKVVQKSSKMMIDEMCKPIINDSPNRLRLKRTVSSLENINILNELLFSSFGKHRDMVCRFVDNNQGKKLKKKYSQELRHFACYSIIEQVSCRCIGFCKDVLHLDEFQSCGPTINFISQDHLKLFFGAIRSHQGLNNNPTARQLRAVYLKLLIHAEIKQGCIGNCIPLEDIDILVNSCSSIKEPGFISHKLTSKIKCEICLLALIGKKENFLKSLINLKDNGGLVYPNNDVIVICIQTEKNDENL